MQLSSILSLRPKDTDAASISAAIDKAEAASAEALDLASSLDHKAAGSLLTATDAEIDQAERDAAAARRSADRIDALIGELKGALAEAMQREKVDERAARIAEAVRLDGLFVDAWGSNWPAITKAAAKIAAAMRAADAAIDAVDGGLNPFREVPRYEIAAETGYHALINWPDLARARLLDGVLRVAELAPSEIARAQAAADAEMQRYTDRKAQDAAAQAVQAAAYRAQMAMEQAEEDRQRMSRSIPSDRAQTTIRAGNGSSY